MTQHSKTAARLTALVTALSLCCAGCASSLENSIDTLNSLSDTLTGVQGKLDEMPGGDAESAAENVAEQSGEKTATQSSNEFLPVSLADFDAYAKKLVTSGALSYAVAVDERVERSGGFGMATQNSDATADTVYSAGAVSRLYTAAAALTLFDEGKLKLHESVSRYLRDFKLRDKRAGSIKVEQLLNGSSGLPAFDFTNAVTLDANYSSYRSEFLSRLSLEYLAAEPGAFTADCPNGFTLAELVIEKAADQNYSQYLKSAVLSKLKLSRTSTPFLSASVGTYAALYNDVYKRPAAKGNSSGALGVCTTAPELARFGNALFSGELLSEESQILMTADYTQTAYTPVEAEPVFSRGLGWDEVSAQPYKSMGVTALRISSASPAAALVTFPELGISVAVMSSSVPSAELADTLSLAVLAERGIPRFAPELTVEQKTVMAPEIAEFSGVYALENGFARVQINSAGELWFLDYQDGAWYSGQPKKYAYRADNRFSDGKTELYFAQNGKDVYICERSSLSPARGYAERTIAQRLPEYDAPKNAGEVYAAYSARAAKTYLLASSMFTARLFQPVLKIEADEQFAGFITANGAPLKIATQNTASSFLTLAGSGAKNSATLYFISREDEPEQAVFGGAHYADATNARLLSFNEIFEGTLKGDDGVSWYRLPERSKHYLSYWGNARYVVLDENLRVAYDSLEDGRCDYVRTPMGGYLAIMGGDRAQFRVAVRLLSLGEVEDDPVAGVNQIVLE